jgi:hypothetical protein
MLRFYWRKDVAGECTALLFLNTKLNAMKLVNNFKK